MLRGEHERLIIDNWETDYEILQTSKAMTEVKLEGQRLGEHNFLF